MKKIFLITASVLFCAITLSGSTYAEGMTAGAAPKVMSKSETELRSSMKALWESRATLLRAYIISEMNDSKDKDEARDKLLKNAGDLGNSINPYYGSWAGSFLAGFLKKDVRLTEKVIEAAKKVNEKSTDLTEKAKVEATALTENAKVEATALTENAKEKALTLTTEESNKEAPELVNKNKDKAINLIEGAREIAMDLINKAREAALDITEKARERALVRAKEAREEALKLAKKNGMETRATWRVSLPSRIIRPRKT